MEQEIKVSGNNNIVAVNTNGNYNNVVYGLYRTGGEYSGDGRLIEVYKNEEYAKSVCTDLNHEALKNVDDYYDGEDLDLPFYVDELPIFDNECSKNKYYTVVFDGAGNYKSIEIHLGLGKNVVLLYLSTFNNDYNVDLPAPSIESAISKATLIHNDAIQNSLYKYGTSIIYKQENNEK